MTACVLCERPIANMPVFTDVGPLCPDSMGCRRTAYADKQCGAVLTDRGRCEKRANHLLALDGDGEPDLAERRHKYGQTVWNDDVAVKA